MANKTKPAPEKVEQTKPSHSDQHVDQMNSEKSELQNIVVLRPKTIAKKVFFYRGEQDLPALCSILNRPPSLDFQNGIVTYSVGKKFPSIYKPCIIFFDVYGEVNHVETDLKKVFDNYDLISSRPVDLTKDKPQAKEINKEKK